MDHLGFTRSSNQLDHLLQTPDTFVRTPLPEINGGVAIVHIGPARGAVFTAYTVELEAGGSFSPGHAQAFVYVLAGEAMQGRRRLRPGHFEYFPLSSPAPIAARKPARILVFEKPLNDEPPAGFAGDEGSIEATPAMPLGGPDSGLTVRHLFPEDPAYDFAVNTMTYRPGASLPQVEIHVMEHGLLMLEGEGIYRLGDRWYPVHAGDFIWMAPYCPQWFAALGRKPARYIIYKDWNRHPLQSA